MHTVVSPERAHMPQTVCSAEPVGDVFAMREALVRLVGVFAVGDFGSLAKGTDHPPFGPSGRLCAVLVLECCLGEHDVGERRLEDLDWR
jgi:hypothetical protein